MKNSNANGNDENIDQELYFETIKCIDGDVFHLEYHNKRIANTIGKNINLQEYIYPISEKLLRCKVIYSKDEIIDITYYEYEKKQLSAFQLIEDNDIEYKFKYLDRSDIDELSKKSCYDDIVIIKNGYVTDTSIANIAVYKNNQWFTPKIPLLFGTTRNRLIEEDFLKEYPLKVSDLKSIDRFAIMNAMVGFQEIKNFQLIK